MGLVSLFFIFLCEFHHVDSYWKSFWRIPHTVSVKTASSKIRFSKIYHDFWLSDFHGVQDLGQISQKNTELRFLKIPGKFVEFDGFYTHVTFPSVNSRWILIFLSTENNPPEIRINQKEYKPSVEWMIFAAASRY